MPVCNNLSVGVLIQNSRGEYLVFDRARPPTGVAPVAGHVDTHGTFEDAACVEVAEEVGLTVTDLVPVLSGWRNNRCRRAVQAGRAPGHHWTVYRATVTAELTPSAEETRNARWLTAAELQALADRTAAYACGELGNAEWATTPGIEPVWMAWLVTADIITMAPDALAMVDQLAPAPCRRITARHGEPDRRCMKKDEKNSLSPTILFLEISRENISGDDCHHSQGFTASIY